MGMLTSPWEDLSFASKGEVACSTARYDNWLINSIHQIGDSVYVVTAKVIESALSENLNLDLLGPLSADDSDMEVIRIKKTIYLPTPYVGIFLERDLTPNYAWSRLQGAIVDARGEVGCQTIIDWIRIALMNNSGEDQPYPLAIILPTAPLADVDLIRHCHQILTCNLPGTNPTLQRVQGYLIDTHIGEVAVEI